MAVLRGTREEVEVEVTDNLLGFVINDLVELNVREPDLLEPKRLGLISYVVVGDPIERLCDRKKALDDSIHGEVLLNFGEVHFVFGA